VDLKPSTPNSITDKRRLWQHLRKVRQDGIAYDFEENVIGGVCLGTVVRNHTRKPIAAMSISTPTQRLPGEKLMSFRDYLLEAARRLSAELGYQPGPAPGTPKEAPVH
jgi:DNA-binding IclR family transcriptional regulator